MNDPRSAAGPEGAGDPEASRRPAFDRAGPYVLGERLAQSTRSAVYRAVDTRDEADAAVKVLAPRPDAPPATAGIEFLREVDLAERVRHPHLLRIRDSGWADGRGWIAYELARQGSLQDRIGRAGHLEASEVRRVAREVGAALAAVHAAGLVHRDVKPSNVLVDGDRYLLGDFGASKALDVEGTATLVGSVPYMAPEQAHGAVSPQTDVYCLGATLYRVWTGANPPPLAQRRPDWPAHTEDDLPLRRVIDAMLDPLPERRPALEAVAGMIERRWQRLRRPAAALAVALLALPVVWALWPEAPTEAPGIDVAGAANPTAVATIAATASAAPAVVETATEVMAAPPLAYPDGRLVMTEDDPNGHWGPNPVYYLHRGIRYHVAEAGVLHEQVAFFVARPAGPLGWASWPPCCVPYEEIADLLEGPELVAADARSEGLLLRRDGDDTTWIVTGGARVPATAALVGASAGPQALDDAIILAPAVFDAIPTVEDLAAGAAAPVAATEPPCLVAGGDIARRYEQHRDGLGASLACEQPLPDGGAYGRWENGTIWWAPGLGATLTVLAIDAAYWAEGGATGWLGYPTEAETDEPTGTWVRISSFQRGVIAWSPDTGAEAMPASTYVKHTNERAAELGLGCASPSFALAFLGTVPAGEFGASAPEGLLGYEFAPPAGLLYQGVILESTAVQTPWTGLAGWGRRDNSVVVIVPGAVVPGDYAISLTLPDGRCGDGTLTVAAETQG